MSFHSEHVQDTESSRDDLIFPIFLTKTTDNQNLIKTDKINRKLKNSIIRYNKGTSKNSDGPVDTQEFMNIPGTAPTKNKKKPTELPIISLFN